MIQAFLEHYQTPDSAVPVLKGMYGFKTLVKIKYILKSHRFSGLIVLQQCPQFLPNALWRCGFPPADLIWDSFILSDSKPGFQCI